MIVATHKFVAILLSGVMLWASIWCCCPTVSATPIAAETPAHSCCTKQSIAQPLQSCHGQAPGQNEDGSCPQCPFQQIRQLVNSTGEAKLIVHSPLHFLAMPSDMPEIIGASLFTSLERIDSAIESPPSTLLALHTCLLC